MTLLIDYPVSKDIVNWEDYQMMEPLLIDYNLS